MILRRIIPLAFWLSIVLLMAAGMLVPGAASAHSGHGERIGSPRPVTLHLSAAATTPGPENQLASGVQDIEAMRGNDGANLFEQSTVKGACGGAACCCTGHGCCAAYLVGGVEFPPPPVASCLMAILTVLRLGFDNTSIPEPPRPAR
jgi:hypothetical protein